MTKPNQTEPIFVAHFYVSVAKKCFICKKIRNAKIFSIASSFIFFMCGNVMDVCN